MAKEKYQILVSTVESLWHHIVKSPLLFSQTRTQSKEHRVQDLEI